MKLLSKEKVAEYLEVSPRTVGERYRNCPDFPRPYKINRLLRWDQDEIEKWVKKQKEH